MRGAIFFILPSFSNLDIFLDIEDTDELNIISGKGIGKKFPLDKLFYKNKDNFFH